MDSVSRALLMVSGGATAAPPGQILYEGPANGASTTFSFEVPAGVTSISVVCVAPGVGGNPNASSSGGNLAYGNNISVTPGETLTVVAGGGGRDYSQVVASKIARGATNLVLANVLRGANSGANLGGGGLGGSSPSNGNFAGFGAGGAGGYTGAGGNGNDNGRGQDGAGGGGGGGGSAQVKSTTVGSTDYYLQGGGGGGGGVGLLGQGSSGSGGTAGSGGSSTTAIGGNPGGGGSSAPASAGTGSSANTSSAGQGGGGGGYGGAGGGTAYSQGVQYDPETGEPIIVFESSGGFGPGHRGAVRIIWPGTTRQFPSTNTGNV